MPIILVTERQMGSRLNKTPKHAVSRPIFRRLSVGSGNSNMFYPFKPSVLFAGTYANRADQDQTPQNAASDQRLHCLLTE